MHRSKSQGRGMAVGRVVGGGMAVFLALTSKTIGAAGATGAVVLGFALETVRMTVFGLCLVHQARNTSDTYLVVSH